MEQETKQVSEYLIQAIKDAQPTAEQEQQAEPSQEEEEEKLLFKQQESQQPEPRISNTIEPSIKEIERFLLFLNKKFELGLKFDNITILISQAHPSTLGYFSPNGFKNTTQSLNGLVLNSIYLKEHPYETIAHELAHYYNNQNGIKDASRNQYHNKHFKKVAERLLLECDARSSKGYAFTRETPAFFEMLKEFEPSPNAFHINQIGKPKATRTPSRLLLFVCGCGCKIRTAKNEDKPLKAVCQYCNTEFKHNSQSESDGESEV